ncbi:MAG: T9SS type A sorting domain-containing protein [Bacteroidota bacterium]
MKKNNKKTLLCLLALTLAATCGRAQHRDGKIQQPRHTPQTGQAISQGRFRGVTFDKITLPASNPGFRSGGRRENATDVSPVWPYTPESANFWTGLNGPSDGYVMALAVSRARGGSLLFAGTFSHGVFLSTNSGASWTAVNVGLTDTSVLSLAVSPDTSGGWTIMFAGTYGGGVFVSTNSGTSWKAVNNGLTNTIVSALATGTNGSGGTNVFAGTDAGVFFTTNSGVSWTAVNSGLPNEPVYALAVSPPDSAGSGTQSLFAGLYLGGVYRSTDNGAHWTAVNTGLKDTTIRALAVGPRDSTGVAELFAGTGSGVFLSTNNGTSWTAVDSGVTNTDVWALVVGSGGSNVFAGTAGGGVYLSTNNGTSWTPASSGLTTGFVTTLIVDSAGRIFAGTWGDRVFSARPATGLTFTFNQGWNMVSLQLKPVIGLTATTLFPQASSSAFTYADSSYSVSGTLDNGVGYWLHFYLPETSVVLGTPLTSETLAVHQGWNMIGSVREPIPTGDITSDSAGLVTSQFFGYGAGYFVSDTTQPGSGYWVNRGYFVSDTIQPGSGYWVKVSRDGRMILSPVPAGMSKHSAASRIQIIRTNDMPPPPPGGMPLQIPRVAAEWKLEDAYPNPFNPTTNFEFRIASAAGGGFVSLKVYDELGREMATLVNEVKPPGEYTVTWNAASCSSGVYFCRLEATSLAGNRFVSVKKLLLMK